MADRGLATISMTERIFLDTNVLVYAVDSADRTKQATALAVLEDPSLRAGFAISTQVLQEFYVTVTRKLETPLTPAEAMLQVRELEALTVVLVDTDLIHSAILTSDRHGFSFRDALIIESAIRASCHRLLTEDLQDGFVVRDRLVVENPFRAGG
jgi:predicted nucleic acid-binding protein